MGTNGLDTALGIGGEDSWTWGGKGMSEVTVGSTGCYNWHDPRAHIIARNSEVLATHCIVYEQTHLSGFGNFISI